MFEFRISKGEKAYFIKPYRNGGLWIENEEGEGMKITQDRLYEVFNDIWKRTF